MKKGHYFVSVFDMPRQARLDAPGVLHRVFIRVIEGRNIFKADDDRDDLIERLSLLLGSVKSFSHFLFWRPINLTVWGS